MKFLVTADWHISNKNSRFRVNNDGVSDLLIAQSNFVKWLVDELNTGKYDGLLFLGDLTDYATLDPVTMTFVNEMVGDLVATNVPMVFIEGNHCISDKQNNYTVVEALSKIVKVDHCNFVSKNESITWNIRGQDVTFHCFSYLSDFEKIESEVAELNSRIDPVKDINVMLFHFPTVNAVLDNGVQSINGVNLSRGITNNFDVCLGGDFHKPQCLVNNENAYYVGAPFDLKFGQEGERGVAVLSLHGEGYDLEHLPNPFDHPMITLEGAGAVSHLENTSYLGRTIVRLSSPPSESDRAKLEKMRPELYSLIIPGVRKMEKTELSSVRVIETFDSGRDLDVISRLVKSYDVDSDVKEEAGRVFQQISELV